MAPPPTKKYQNFVKIHGVAKLNHLGDSPVKTLL